MPNSDVLRIFVAMPGTDMGANAIYKNPQSVRANLLEPVVERLEAKLGRQVELVIEKEKLRVGPIHESMFAEARDAEVYIADLTGANPNVYLELGVRWALRDRVTVPIVQSIDDLKFNVGSSRVILYYPDIIIKAIDDIVTTILDGLSNKICDSVVRRNNEWVAISRSELTELKDEIARLKTVRGEDLLRVAQAKSEHQLSERLSLLKQAADVNPSSVEILLELGKTHRALSQYAEAVDILQTARRLNSDNAVVHRELGASYSKWEKPEFAVVSLREAVRINPEDVETWNNLGGALRRLGMASAPDRYDQQALEESRASYSRAYDVKNLDLYAALNIARLDLLLSKWEPQRLQQAKEEFEAQIFLCRHMVKLAPMDYWRHFDLADALLFSGDYEKAMEVFSRAVELIPMEVRKDTLTSVLGPLQNYLTANVLKDDLLVEVKKVVETLEDIKERS